MAREEAGAGCVEIRGAQANLVTRGESHWQRRLIPIASTAGEALDNQRGVAFIRWRLIRRDHLGGPIALFTYDIEAAVQPH